MTDEELIGLLAGHACDHSVLKIEDNKVVEQVCASLTVNREFDLGSVNDHHRRQTALEATMVYLCSKYSILLGKLEDSLNEYIADRSQDLGSKDEEGYKWTKASKREYFQANDPEYNVKYSRYRAAKSLVELLDGMREVVFNRANTLEQLSINYRREMKIDERSTD